MQRFQGLSAAAGLAFVVACVACHEGTAVAVPRSAAAAASSPAVTASASPNEHGLPIGTKVPAFRLERLDGRGSVGVPSGRVTILVFIATWNGPAKNMLTPLQKIHAEYAAKGIDVIAISVDDQVDGVREFGETYGAKFPIVWDEAHVVTTKLRPPSMPTA